MFSFTNYKAVIIACVAFVVAGCGSSDSSFSGESLAAVRVLHAVPDAPRVNVLLNEEVVLSDVDFRVGSAFLSVDAGSYDVRVDAILPGGATTTVLEAASVEFAADTATTLIAAGTVGGGIVAVPQAEATEEIGPDNLRVKVTHASSAAPPVWVSFADGDIGQATFLGPIEFAPNDQAKNSIGPVEVPAGSYRARVIARDPVNLDITDADVVFDSGVLDLPAGADLNIVAVTSTVPSTAQAPSPISLVVLDGLGASDIFDVNTGSNLRAVHNSPGVPAVNIFADVTATPEDENILLVENLSYAESAGYLVVPSTEFDVGIRLFPDGTQDAISFTADLMTGMGYTAIATVDTNMGNMPSAVILEDGFDYRPVATEAKVRLVHGSPSTPAVDIYVFPSSAALLPADADAPFLEDVVFGDATGFVALDPGSYDVYITLANDPNPAISVTGLPVAAGGVYTAIARDPDPNVANDTAGVILIADVP